MSDTTLDATAAAPAPGRQPAPALTGAPATVHAHLTTLDEAVSAAEIALAAKIGHSTTGKALTTLEKLGLAVRTPGTFNGSRRTPDLWRATTRGASTDDMPRPPASSAPTPTTVPPQPLTETESGANPPNPTATANDAATAAEPPTAADALQEAPQHDIEHGDSTGPTVDDTDSSTPDSAAPAETAATAETASAPQEPPAQPVAQARAAGRLAPGGLRQMVIDHLSAHPDQAFTATKISRVIERSSGAIANALVTLTKQGLAERVNDKPLMYRLATTPPAPQ